jgi:hypothetical protein
MRPEAFDPETEISGRAMLALIRCIVADEISDIVKRHGVDSETLDPEAWYPLQTWLDVFQDIAHQLNHRNRYAGELSTTILGPGHLQVVDHTPYSEDYTYGFLYGLAHRFKPAGVHPTVRYDDEAPCRKRGTTRARMILPGNNQGIRRAGIST